MILTGSWQAWRMTSRTAALGGLLLALTVSLVGCGGSEGSTSNGSITEVLAEAKKQFDEAASVQLTLATSSVPSSGDAVLGAAGVLTQQPAFEGEVTVLLSGFNADVPVVAVDGVVFAKLPLTTDFEEIDPSEYGAPDPADFADLDRGISAMLLELDGAKESGQKREGDQVLTTYTGTLAGSIVSPIIPSADEDSTYDTVVGIDSDGRLSTIEVTGAFFSGADRVTYDLTFDSYGEDVTITAP